MTKPDADARKAKPTKADVAAAERLKELAAIDDAYDDGEIERFDDYVKMRDVLVEERGVLRYLEQKK